jgi:2-hydroxy-4-(methylsulfanyl)butanoate S-methyltransferase
MADSPPLEPISRLYNAVYPSFALLAGMQLDLFTPLKDGSLTVEQLADALGIGTLKLRPLLDALAVAGLLTVNDDLFANTPEADHYLVRGKPAYVGASHGLLLDLWNATLKTAETIRSGVAQAKHDYKSMSQAELTAMLRGLHGGSIGRARALMAQDDFSAYQSLVDIGGGSGGLAITMTQDFPQLKATVIDLPLITPITRQFVSEAEASDRVTIVTADAVHDSLTGSFDVAVASSFTQVLAAEEVLTAFRNIATILVPGGVLHVITAVLDNSRLSPIETVGVNLVFQNIYDGGQAYTEQEYHSWLIEAGYADFKRVTLPAGSSILTAHKPR